MTLQEIRNRFYDELNKPEPNADALWELLQEAINHAVTSETAFGDLWDTHQRLGGELEEAPARKG